MNQLVSLKRKRLYDKKCRRYTNSINGKLYLTIADADFKVSKAIIKDVVSCVEIGDISYKYQKDELYDAVNKWYKKSWDIDFDKEDILFANGVLYWIHVAIYAFSKKGDNILVMPPVYDPFYNLIKRTDRKMIKSNLVYKDHKWAIDFKDLEKKMVLSKLLLLCSPHNPTGNIWTREQLIKINDLAIKHNVILVADEIWQDVILDGNFEHSLNLKNVSKVVHIASPAKTYNLGGLQYGHMICKNTTLMKQMAKGHDALMSYSSSQPWITAAVVSAYTNPKNNVWKNEYIDLLSYNAHKLSNFLKDNDYNYAYPYGVSLMFIELGDKKMHSDVMLKKLFDLGAVVTPGHNYGSEYKTWVRVNIAISAKDMALFIKILEQLKNNGKD
ncbi:aminotransferase class I/II-fold pyridoxal phosphate-dependent enzyme [Candidatus Mycoplasma mahonii]|uniref:aminotransferase class I/II-fold pyridoxal phosphate-dependent enzyme n=1 Tax=Candidatus Mycoplasma mahonii TaxID=3004105 RepID=UPI0026F23822|nr:aminotransferase class I/II-fold pyridoxal phosphate-dependent enzyme [Candidatus Mycoplasma mahonii]WKX02745.1 aminotransferase class I/II-fold pyridoxal phosphate-dependent enzyme [Candidatus Mycoplasma mahonii]